MKTNNANFRIHKQTILANQLQFDKKLIFLFSVSVSIFFFSCFTAVQWQMPFWTGKFQTSSNFHTWFRFAYATIITYSIITAVARLLATKTLLLLPIAKIENTEIYPAIMLFRLVQIEKMKKRVRTFN